jgi:hypothetical protein
VVSQSFKLGRSNAQRAQTYQLEITPPTRELPWLSHWQGKNVEEFSEWWCWHVNRVRSTIKRYNGTLVEVDIGDSNAGQHMGEMFGINPSCWGRANVNTQIHQDLNQTVIGRLPWLMTDGFGPTGQRIFNVSNNRQVVQL